MEPSTNVSDFSRLELRIQHCLDRLTPWVLTRWLINLILLMIYIIRIYIIQSFYLITYALGIFLLNQFLLFLTPSELPSVVDMTDDGPTLPTTSTEEFRPFMRRLPEFKFWYSTFKSLCICFLLTLFQIFDIPVFWPILFIYFLMLFFLTMRQRILHMIQYRYVPFTHGKIRYAGKSDDQEEAKTTVI